MFSPVNRVNNQEPRATPAIPDTPKIMDALLSTFFRIKCPYPPDIAVKITANNVVPTASGAGKPIQKCNIGSITLQPPVPIIPPRKPAIIPTTKRIIIKSHVSSGASCGRLKDRRIERSSIIPIIISKIVTGKYLNNNCFLNRVLSDIAGKHTPIYLKISICIVSSKK